MQKNKVIPLGINSIFNAVIPASKRFSPNRCGRNNVYAATKKPIIFFIAVN